MTGSQMNRPQLGAALEYLRQGDTLVLWKMDRAGRNTRGVLKLVEDLTRRGIGLRSITEQISSTGHGKGHPDCHARLRDSGT